MRLTHTPLANRTGASPTFITDPQIYFYLCSSSFSPVTRKETFLPLWVSPLILLNLHKDIASAIVSFPLHPLFVLFPWMVLSSYGHAHVFIFKKRVTITNKTNSSNPIEPSLPDSLLSASQQNLKCTSTHCLHSLNPSFSPSVCSHQFHPTLHWLLLLGPLTSCVLPKGHVPALMLP